MRRYQVWLAVGGLVALASRPALLSAQGFSVNEHSTCAMGRAGTGVAAPCADGSAMVFNPAGLVMMPAGSTVLTINGTFIAPTGDFTDDATGLKSDMKDRVFPVPAIYLAHGFSERFAAGIGLFAPYGLTTDWPTTAQGRFSSYKSVIRNIYVQPTAAYAVSKQVMLGGGFDVNFLHLELRRRADLSEVALPSGGTFANIGIPQGTDFADAKITGSKTTFGFHAGVIVKPVERVSIGARYLSRQKAKDIKGHADFTQIATGLHVTPGSPLSLPPNLGGLGLPTGASIDTLVLAPNFVAGGPLSDQDGSTTIRLPEQLTLGLAVRPTEKLQVLFDYTMQNWEVFDTLVLALDLAGSDTLPQEFRKTHTWRVGAEYNVGTSSVIRAGYLTHNAAAPSQTVTPTLPEGPRTEFTVGFGTRLGQQLHLDLAYQYIDQADRRGRTGGPGTANNGLYQFKANLFGASLSYNF